MHLIFHCAVICDIDSPCSEPWYKDLVYDWHVVRHPKRDISRWMYRTYVVEGRRYLPWLTKQFCTNGGEIIKRTINDLSELKDYDIIINCAGLGAKQLVNDPLLHPIGGQVVAVKPQQPIETVYERFGESSPLVIPHHDYVVLGGTDVKDHWSEDPDPLTTKQLYDMCLEVMPTLKGAQIVDSWVGLRPARDTVRLEVDDNLSKALSTVRLACVNHRDQSHSIINRCRVAVTVPMSFTAMVMVVKGMCSIGAVHKKFSHLLRNV